MSEMPRCLQGIENFFIWVDARADFCSVVGQALSPLKLPGLGERDLPNGFFHHGGNLIENRPSIMKSLFLALSAIASFCCRSSSVRPSLTRSPTPSPSPATTFWAQTPSLTHSRAALAIYHDPLVQ